MNSTQKNTDFRNSKPKNTPLIPVHPLAKSTPWGRDKSSSALTTVKKSKRRSGKDARPKPSSRPRPRSSSENQTIDTTESDDNDETDGRHGARGPKHKRPKVISYHKSGRSSYHKKKHYSGNKYKSVSYRKSFYKAVSGADSDSESRVNNHKTKTHRDIDMPDVS